MIVVDTNVIAYAVLEGPRSAAAAGVLRRDPEWAAPPLWRSEFRSVLVQAIRRGHLGLPAARALLGAAALPLGGREREAAPERVLAMAVATGCSAYDCEFAALAEALAVPLVTGDRQVLRAFPDLALSPEAFARG